ncbi:MAG: hypothetical protein RLZZ519_943 [Bacteroidota bacterium]|jgi:hypothetical protein
MKTYRSTIYWVAFMVLFATACSENGCKSSDGRSEEAAAVVGAAESVDSAAYRPENGELKFESK